MVNLGFKSWKKPLTVTVTFKLPYYTQWGQSLLISGSHPILGSWNVKQGLVMTPFHLGDELIWCGKITVAVGFECEYSYYLVDDSRNILRWEAGIKRKLVLPLGVKEKVIVEIRDLWQTASEALFQRSAFKNVIFGGGQSFEPEIFSGSSQKNTDLQDFVMIQFKISCPIIKEGTSVCVTGSASQLGQWRVQDGLKLLYAGESIWQADCLVRKDEFPIKYPFIC